MRLRGRAAGGPRSGPPAGGSGGPHILIHTNNCSNPRPAYVSGQLAPLVWMYDSGLRAAGKARAETEANPTGPGWLVIPVPHSVERNCWIVGRVDAIADLCRREADGAAST